MDNLPSYRALKRLRGMTPVCYFVLYKAEYLADDDFNFIFQIKKKHLFFNT